MITQATILKPIPLGLTAIQVAAAAYKEWMTDASLEEDIAHHLAYGLVLSLPSCFALVQPIEDPKTGEPAWFVRMAVGRLDELLYHLPFVLPRICLCRGKKGDLRIRSYSLERFMQLTGGKLYGRWSTRSR